MQQSDKLITYPAARRGDQVDDYHGASVADPYRWLEDPDSPETRAWIEAENKITFDFLSQIPAREAIKQRLTKLWNYERYGIPFKRGNRYFFTRNDGLQNQAVLHTVTSLDASPQLLLDPNKLSEDGTVALTGLALNEDGSLMAYGLSAAGSDWQEWRVRNVETGDDLPDYIKWVKFSNASWLKSGLETGAEGGTNVQGFFYSRFAEPKADTMLQDTNYFQKLYFHRLGTAQSDDHLIYERPDRKDWQFGGYVTDDGQYLIIHISEGTDPRNRIYYKDLQSSDSAVVELLDNFDAAYNFIDNDGPIFWFSTDLNAPRGRVIAIDTRQPAPEHWREIIPQSADTLQGVSLVDDKFIAAYLKDARSQVRVFGLNGSLIREAELPGIGSVGGFGGRRKDHETFYSFTSFTTPSTIYRYDVGSGRSELFRQPVVAFNPTDYETSQVFYPSKDGTMIPMFITHRKEIKLNGGNPTYLYGYGGFNISLTPAFSVSILTWLELGGVFAEANLRGGGEYGEDWHQAGTKLRKQNVFDDFIAAAEWLIANKYTSTPKLAIGGGSNGGLLVGACVTQRPDLFGAVLSAVGVLDMLRFHKFTIGWAWISDYGSADNPEEFKALYAYSPLHNITPGISYPATLITTADHDDRVVPAHSFKFAAALQAAQAGPAPILIRIETKAGHGAGKPTTKIIEEAADVWSFLVRVLQVDASELKV